MEQQNEKISLGAQALLFPEPALVIGSYDQNGRANAMTAAWAGVCGDAPPRIQVSVRPARWTHAAVLANRAFTVNIPSAQMAEVVDYLGIASGRNLDKIAVAKLTPLASTLVKAPFFAEFPVCIECELAETLDVGSHTLMIGTVRDVKVNADCLDEAGGHIDILKVAPLLFDGAMRRYFAVGAPLGKAFSMGKPLLRGQG